MDQDANDSLASRFAYTLALILAIPATEYIFERSSKTYSTDATKQGQKVNGPDKTLDHLTGNPAYTIELNRERGPLSKVPSVPPGGTDILLDFWVREETGRQYEAVIEGNGTRKVYRLLYSNDLGNFKLPCSRRNLPRGTYRLTVRHRGAQDGERLHQYQFRVE